MHLFHLHRRFALFVPLALAGITLIALQIVLQPSSQLRGDVMPGTQIGGDQCQMKIVEGFLQQCCKSEYSEYLDCRLFSATFDDFCKKTGFEGCNMINISCEGETIGHRINQAIIDGKLCLVEPQGRIISCDLGPPDEKYQNAICAAMHKPEGCACTGKMYDPAQSGRDKWTDFSSCALIYAGISGKSYSDQCISCCDKFGPFENATAQKWHDECVLTCWQMYGTRECKDNCSKGFFGTCNRKTCRQSYNTGFCDASNTSGACKILQRMCPNPIENCDNPSQIIQCGNTKAPTCNGACPRGEVCTAGDGSCKCIAKIDPSVCGNSAPACNGSCPENFTCGNVGKGDQISCECHGPAYWANTPPPPPPVVMTECGKTAPECNGQCPTGETCYDYKYDGSADSCKCFPPSDKPCGDTSPVCNGKCPAGEYCHASIFAGINCSCAPKEPEDRK